MGCKNHKNCKLTPTYNLHITPFAYNVFLDIKIAEENAELAEFIAETEKVSFSKTSSSLSRQSATAIFDYNVFSLFIFLVVVVVVFFILF